MITATDAIQGSTRDLGSRRDRIVYWATTGIVCAVMVFSIINFTFIDRFPFPEGAFVHLGLPKYFRAELTVAKALEFWRCWCQAFRPGSRSSPTSGSGSP